MYDQIKQDVISLADVIGEKMAAMGPEVAEAAMGVARIDGIAELLPAVPLMALSLSLSVMSFYCFKMSKKAKLERPRLDDWDMTAFWSAIGSVMFFALSLVQICDIWAWVAIFEPKLYIAHQAIEVIAGSK